MVVNMPSRSFLKPINIGIVMRRQDRAIEKLDAQRRALCPTSNVAGIAATVAERWRALMELMARCRTANEVNGHIINVRRNQVRQLLDIVRGGPAITYDPQGKTFAKALRALARA